MTSFVPDRKQRLVYNGTVCDWMMTSKRTTQGSTSVSRPHLFNLLLDDDLETDSNLDDVSMVKLSTRTVIPLYWLPWTKVWTTLRERNLNLNLWFGPIIIE